MSDDELVITGRFADTPKAQRIRELIGKPMVDPKAAERITRGIHGMYRDDCACELCSDRQNLQTP